MLFRFVERDQVTLFGFLTGRDAIRWIIFLVVNEARHVPLLTPPHYIESVWLISTRNVMDTTPSVSANSNWHFSLTVDKKKNE